MTKVAELRKIRLRLRGREESEKESKRAIGDKRCHQNDSMEKAALEAELQTGQLTNYLQTNLRLRKSCATLLERP